MNFTQNSGMAGWMALNASMETHGNETDKSR